MKQLRTAVIVLFTAWLCLGAWVMPGFAGLGSSTAPVEQAMAVAMPDAGGCAEQGHAKKSDSCCTQCPCCIALPSELAAVTASRPALPIAMALALQDGLRMPPEPAPPRFRA